jgi:hypothetical protein
VVFLRREGSTVKIPTRSLIKIRCQRGLRGFLEHGVHVAAAVSGTPVDADPAEVFQAAQDAPYRPGVEGLAGLLPGPVP